MDTDAIYKLTNGIYVLTTRYGGNDYGCIINTAVQVSSEPVRISVCVNKQNLTHDMVRRSGKFTVSVISENADDSLIKRFGYQSGRYTDKFENFADYKRCKNGVTYITEGTNAYLSAEVEKEKDVGTHTIFIGIVTDMMLLSEDDSATYDFYQKKGLATMNTKFDASEMEVFKCRICGFVHAGKKIQRNFSCPFCSSPSWAFKRICKAASF